MAGKEMKETPENAETPGREIEDTGKHLAHSHIHLDPNNPHNWHWPLKNSILLCISILGFLGTYNSSLAVASFENLAEEFGTTITQESYLVGIAALWLGVGPLVWNPFAQTHGRRPVYVFSTLIALLGVIWCATAKNYPSMVVARAFTSFGLSAVHSLGGVTVADLFPENIRGTKVGVWALMTVLGPYVGTIAGAYIANDWGWRAVFWHEVIIIGVLLIYEIFFLPETLYFQGNVDEQQHGKRIVPLYKMRIRPFAHAEIPRWWSAFCRPLMMLKYPNCWLPGLMYAIIFSWDIAIAVTIGLTYEKTYHLKAPSVYLIFFAPLIGASIGELTGGPSSDYVMMQFARRRNGQRIPEARLHALYLGMTLIVVGLIEFGVTLQQKTHYVIPLIGFAIFIFGMQSITTIVFTYPVDCYTLQASDALALLGVFKNVMSFVIPFYINPWLNSQGPAKTYGLQAGLSVFMFVTCVVPLIIWGRKLRKWAGMPSWNLSYVSPPDDLDTS